MQKWNQSWFWNIFILGKWDKKTLEYIVSLWQKRQRLRGSHRSHLCFLHFANSVLCWSKTAFGCERKEKWWGFSRNPFHNLLLWRWNECLDHLQSFWKKYQCSKQGNVCKSPVGTGSEPLGDFGFLLFQVFQSG